MIWNKTPNIQELNKLCENSAVSHIGIEFTDFGDDWIQANVPVDHRTTQPFGLLHGGISATLAETLGSVGALLCCEENQIPVGTELNIQHLKAAQSGKVFAKAFPLQKNNDYHTWQIDLYNQQNELCSTAKLDVKLITKK